VSDGSSQAVIKNVATATTLRIRAAVAVVVRMTPPPPVLIDGPDHANRSDIRNAGIVPLIGVHHVRAATRVRA
jgi:hypothetical protein